MSDAKKTAPDDAQQKGAKAKGRTQARAPRGFEDRGAGDLAATRRMMETIRTVYERYGFDGLETPFIEYTDALGKFLPDQDRPNEGVFSFQDDDEQWLSLRYDLTAPLARYVAQNYDALPKPYRSYRTGWVFRNEKPGPGRFRQFMQFDADTVGSASVAADAEMCMMAADTLEALGIKRGDYVIKVNNRKILDGVMEAIGLGGDENAARRLIVLRAIDKLDRLGEEGVRLLLGPGRKDESGDFTKGAGLEEWQIDRLIQYLQLALKLAQLSLGYRNDPYQSAAMLDTALDQLSMITAQASIGGEGVSELREIAKLVASSGYNNGRVVIDPSVVRGLEYYTGPVFEAELTFEVKDDNGKPIRFGSVGGGGRYDGLVGRFRGESVPATGFSIGVSRLLAALQAVKSPLVANAAPLGPVVVTVMDKDRVSDYQAMVSQLRHADIRAELYLGSAGFGAQMKYADKRHAPCVIIQGSDEKAKGEITIKDLALGAELAAMGRDAKDREDYLAKQAEAQISVPESELVEAVNRVIARRT
jgi:histidyl-tRNA synthetase